MRRFITLTITVVLCFLLQTAVFPFFKLADIMPNILIILVVSFALMRGKIEGMIIGFFCGLLIDILYGGPLGIYAFIYMILGFLNGFLNKLFYAEDIILPLAMIALNDLFYNFIIYVFYFLLRNRLDLLYYVRNIMIPEVVYTTLVTLVIYKILLFVNTKLEEYEKRSVI